jgi:hypothetical protein
MMICQFGCPDASTRATVGARQPRLGGLVRAWLTPGPWTVVAGRESCQVLEADATRGRRAVSRRAGRRYDS